MSLLSYLISAGVLLLLFANCLLIQCIENLLHRIADSSWEYRYHDSPQVPQNSEYIISILTNGRLFLFEHTDMSTGISTLYAELCDLTAGRNPVLTRDPESFRESDVLNVLDSLGKQADKPEVISRLQSAVRDSDDIIRKMTAIGSI